MNQSLSSESKVKVETKVCTVRRCSFAPQNERIGNFQLAFQVKTKQKENVIGDFWNLSDV
jgi:hypothetical protein